MSERDDHDDAAIELDLVGRYQVFASVAAEARRIFDRALKELIKAEIEAERVGCALDEFRRAKR